MGQGACTVIADAAVLGYTYPKDSSYPLAALRPQQELCATNRLATMFAGVKVSALTRTSHSEAQ